MRTYMYSEFFKIFKKMEQIYGPYGGMILAADDMLTSVDDFCSAGNQTSPIPL